MAIFVTGGTGYIGGYVLASLLARSDERILVLAREATPARLWRALQLHLDPPTFERHLEARIELVPGDITRPRLGLDEATHADLAARADSILHCAASLNRRSEKACLNANLRGTLEMIQFARRARDDGGLRRFSHVSTVAVAGRRQDETVLEDAAIEWDRSDYDPYARTKKFCEHMLRELLPDVPRTIFRPSVVLGDSRRGETTQFDMVRAFVFLARLPLLPLRREHRIDIVPADYVAEAIATLHLEEAPPHEIYHLSSGTDSLSYDEITTALATARGKRRPWFAPWLRWPFRAGVGLLADAFRGSALGVAAARLQVFLPYLTFNTVFDNARVVTALGRKPVPFREYCAPLLEFSLEHRFQYPYQEWPP